MNSRVQGGLKLLLEADSYAREVSSDARQFAVALPDLSAVGLLRLDMHWLISKGFVEHISESHRKGQPVRVFATADPSDLTDRSCFVLTKAGLRAAKQIDKESRPSTGTGGETREHILRIDADEPLLSMPHWDAGRRTLFFGSLIVKEFLVPAESQEAVLAAFERVGWQECIDNPLLDGPEICRERRLHDAISRLNRRQRHQCLRFHGNGTATGVRWERIELHRP